MTDDNRYMAFVKGKHEFDSTYPFMRFYWEGLDVGEVLVTDRWVGRKIATYSNENVFLVDYQWA